MQQRAGSPMTMARPSHDSTASESNGLSISPESDASDEIRIDYPSSIVESSTPKSRHRDTSPASHPALISQNATPPEAIHVIKLSAIEQCMPRAYIRLCLSYRVPADVTPATVLAKLNRFVRKVVDAKPYLAGNVVPAEDANIYTGKSEIHFTDDQFLNFPEVDVRFLAEQEVSGTYDELDGMCLPPSTIPPDLVSSLPEGTDNQSAPVFRVQANFLRGGLVVSFWLHHCVSDGNGIESLIMGRVLNDDFAFERHVDAGGYASPGLNMRLAIFSNHMTIVRQALSWSFHNQISDRRLNYKTNSVDGPVKAANRVSGRGCLLAFSRSKLSDLERRLQAHISGSIKLSGGDALHALLWHHMIMARQTSLELPLTASAKLFIPADLRRRLPELLKPSYFGAAVDFAVAEMPLKHLLSYDHHNPAALAESAIAIRHAIARVDEQYVRQAIALAQVPDPTVDVRDLMGSNMNRSSGADMYITSWRGFDLYKADLEVGLGQPDWVRKPWSKDPGSVIIMPDDNRKAYVEALVQMTEYDIERLLIDEIFMQYVSRVTD